MLLRIQGMLLLLLLAGSSRGQAPAIPTENPSAGLPFRRVLLTEDRKPPKAGEGRSPLLRMPVAEFEALVQAAEAARNRRPPRLIAASYRATLQEGGLVGSARWRIVHNEERPALLPLDEMQPAIRSARWRGVPTPFSALTGIGLAHADFPALLGRLESKEAAGPSLLVPGLGTWELGLAWSAGILQQPGELRFELFLPPAPLATLELDLPENLAPQPTQADALLEGPLQDAPAGRRLWRISCGGTSRLEVSLRRRNAHDQPRPFLRTSAAVRQVFSPDEVACVYAFDLEAAHDGIQVIELECDPRLRLLDAVIPNRDTWRIENGPEKNSPRRLIVLLREPIRGGRLEVTATLPLTSDSGSGQWLSPGIRVLGAVPRSERLEWVLHPDLQAEEFHAGDFRIVRTETDAERRQVLALQTSFIDEAKTSWRRPSARFVAPGPEYRLKQESEWIIEADRVRLVVRQNLEVTRGVLHQLPLKLPADWELEQYDVIQREALAGAQLNGRNLTFDWHTPLTVGRSVQITLWLRGLPPKLPNDGSRLGLPFPDLVPLDSGVNRSRDDGTRLGRANREGTLRIRVSPAFQTAITPAVWLTEETIGPASETGVGSVRQFTQRGQGMKGTLFLSRRPPRFTARAATLILMQADRLRVRTRLTLTPEAGAPQTFLLFTTTGLQPGRQWQTLRGANQVADMKRLPELIACGPLNAFGAVGAFDAVPRLAAAGRGHGVWWLVTLARPLQETVELELVAEPEQSVGALELVRRQVAPLLGSQQPLMPPIVLALAELLPVPLRRPTLLPLPIIAGADSFFGTVEAKFPVGSPFVLQPVGASAGRSERGGSYRYDGAALGLTLTTGSTIYREPVIDNGRLLLWLESTGEVRRHFQFRIRGWSEKELRIQLPTSARLVAAAIGGRALAALPRTSIDPDGLSVWVPLLHGDDWQTIEVVWRESATAGTLCGELPLSLPRLPIPLPSVRRLLVLPPPFTPGDGDRLRLLPGLTPDSGSTLLRSLRLLLRQPTPAAEAPLMLLRPAETTGATTISLGEFLRRTMLQPGNEPLILDTEALRELRLDPAKPLQANERPPTWEAVGLIAVSTPGAAVLTTPQQLNAWEAAGRAEGSLLPASIRDALRDAVRFDRDPSGRFRTVPDWLAEYEQLDDDETSLFFPGSFRMLPPGSTVWEIPADPQSVLIVDRRAVLTLTGGLIVPAMIFGVWRAGRRRFATVTLPVWLLLSGVGVVWLPNGLQPPALGLFLTGLLVAGLMIVRLRPPPQLPKTGSSRKQPLRGGPGSSKVVPIAALGLLLGVQASASAPDLPTVWFLPKPGTLEPQTALVPSSLFESLREAADVGPHLAEAVITTVAYSGTTTDAGGNGEGTFTILARRPNAAIVLPTTGLLLRDVLLDGRPAFPQPVGDGVRIPLGHAGQHVVVLRFAVAIQGTGSDREIRFAGVEVPSCSLTWAVPGNIQQYHAVAWRGVQTVRFENGQTVLQADLGRTKTIQLRWREEGPQPTPPLIRTQELHLWDVEAGAAVLFSAANLRVTQGSVSTLDVLVPGDLEPARVSVTPLEGMTGPLSQAIVRNWRLEKTSKADERLLRIDLQSALTGRLRLVLELVPNRPLSATPTLRVPAVLGSAETEIAIGLRLQGIEMNAEPEVLGLAPIPPDAFYREQWLPLAIGRIGAAPVRAFSKGPATQAPQIKPSLRVTAPPIEAAQELLWSLEPNLAQVQGMARWTSQAGLTLVEWEVPTQVQIVEVRGGELRSWSRAGNRVQAWLNKPLTEVTLNWTGTIDKPGKTVAEGMRLDLPTIRQVGAAKYSTILRLRPPDGWTITAEILDGLLVPIRMIEPLDWTATCDRDSYRGRFLLRPPALDGRFRLLKTVELKERFVVMTADLQIDLPASRPHSFQLTLAAPQKGEAVLTPTTDVRIRELPGIGSLRCWRIDLPTRVREESSVRLTYRAAWPKEGDFQVPDLRIVQGNGPNAPVERYLSLPGNELTVREADGLRPLEGEAATPVTRTGGNQGTGRLWSIRDGDWRLRLALGVSPPIPASAVRLALADFESARCDTGWVHRGCWELEHDGGGELELVLPSGTRILASAVDGNEVSLQNNRLYLPEGGGPRLVQLVWQNAADLETTARPRLEPIRLRSGSTILDGPGLWTTYLPFGEGVVVEADNSEARKPLGPVGSRLRRAETQLILLRRLEERGRSGLADVTARGVLLSRCERHLRLAEAYSALERIGDRPEAESSFGNWLAAVREELNRRKSDDIRLPFELLRQGARLRETTWQRLPCADCFQIGRGRTEPTTAAGLASILQVKPIDEITPSARLRRPLRSLFWAFALAVFATAMSLFGPYLRPELLLVLGPLGLFLLGPGSWPMMLPFMIAGGSWRLIKIGRAFGRRLFAQSND